MNRIAVEILRRVKSKFVYNLSITSSIGVNICLYDTFVVAKKLKVNLVLGFVPF